MLRLKWIFFACAWLCSLEGAFAGVARAAELSDLFSNMPGSDWAMVRSAARAQANAQPYYKSNAVEDVTFEGYFKPNTSRAKFGIFSDDGASVVIDGVVVHGRHRVDQALPKLSESLHKIEYVFDPFRTYHIKVEYSNTKLTGNTDIDGVTLFCYDDGGRVVPKPPLELSLLLPRSHYSSNRQVRATISLHGVGTDVYNITMSGPGAVTPGRFPLRVGSFRTVLITLPAVEGEYEYEAQASPSAPPQSTGVVRGTTSSEQSLGCCSGRGRSLFHAPNLAPDLARSRAQLQCRGLLIV